MPTTDDSKPISLIKAEARIRDLEAERNDLQSRLRAALFNLGEVKIAEGTSEEGTVGGNAAVIFGQRERIKELESQVAALEQNLHVEIDAAVETGRSYEQLEFDLSEMTKRAEALQHSLSRIWTAVGLRNGIVDLASYVESVLSDYDDWIVAMRTIFENEMAHWPTCESGNDFSEDGWSRCTCYMSKIRSAFTSNIFTR